MALENFFVHPSSFVEDGTPIGTGTRIWHFCHLMPRCRVGENCIIGQNAFIDNETVIGNRVKIQNNVSVYNGVELEDDVFIGPSVVFTNVINPRSFIERKTEFKKTIIRKGATLGANATILCGIEIGAYAMVGAGAVVTQSVPDYALITGNPAKQTGWVSAAGYKLDFKDGELSVCPKTGENYKIAGNRISPVK